jgi:hypothetical protein
VQGKAIARRGHLRQRTRVDGHVCLRRRGCGENEKPGDGGSDGHPDDRFEHSVPLDISSVHGQVTLDKMERSTFGEVNTELSPDNFFCCKSIMSINIG